MTKKMRASTPAPTGPEPVAPGERVRITKGEVPTWDGSSTHRSACGNRGRVLGGSYVAADGPHKGEVCTQVREHGTNACLSVPVSDLSRVDRVSTRQFGMPKISQERWDQIFGSKE